MNSDRKDIEELVSELRNGRYNAYGYGYHDYTDMAVGIETWVCFCSLQAHPGYLAYYI